MIPLLGNVVEIKNFVPTNQDPKIIQERSHTRFRPMLTNGCSGRRVGEAGGCSGSSRSRSPTNKSLDLSHEQVPRTDLREEEEAPRRRIKCMIPLPVSTRPDVAIQQRSASREERHRDKLEEEQPSSVRTRRI